MVLVAVKQDGTALKYASPELRAAREVVLAAVQRDGMALYYASPELVLDPELMLMAAAQHN